MIIRTIKDFNKAPHIKQEVFANTAPAVTHDVTQNFEVGSRWFNVDTTTRYTCLDNTAGAAVWQAESLTLGINRHVTTTNPLVTSDTAHGFVVGSTWLNSTTKTRFVCVDATNGAAVWISETLTPGLDRCVIDEVVTLTANTHVNLATQLPANAIPVAASLNFDVAVGAMTGTGSPVKVGLGTVASPSGLALSGATLTKNTKTYGRGTLCGVLTTTATTLQLAPCATGGTVGDVADAFSTGTVRVRVYYDVLAAIPDA